MSFYLGIDGGGSRTRAWIATADGCIVARGEAGGSNVHRLGVEAATRMIVASVDEARRACGLFLATQSNPFAAVFAGVAGAGAVADQRALAQTLAKEFGVLPEKCVVDHDLRIALAGALRGEAGVVLVAGTGSGCYGRAADGRTAKAGGWGAELDDGGSGHWIGLQAMRLVVRAADGRLAETTVTQMVMKQLGVTSPREILVRLRDGSLTREKIAALAPHVLEFAAQGQSDAASIVEQGTCELAQMASAVARAIGVTATPIRIAGSGGLIEGGGFYFDRVAAAIFALEPTLKLEIPAAPPAAGAVMLALDLGGIPVGATHNSHIRAR